jgi:malonyl CoA-acyl carrier protein transacylase
MTNQITSRVKWRETIDFLINDKEIDKIVEVAPGQVLSNMITRTYPEANVLSLDSVHKIADFVRCCEES